MDVDMDVDVAEHKYNICFYDDDATSLCYTFSINSGERVQELEAAIRHNDLTAHKVAKKNLLLYKCCTIDRHPMEGRDERVKNWIVENVKVKPTVDAITAMDPSDVLVRYFDERPKEEEKIHIVVIDAAVLNTVLSQTPLLSKDRMVKLWKEAWGIPLSDLSTGRPMGSDRSHIQTEDGDLPEGPILKRIFHGETFVRAEYPRFYEFVEAQFAVHGRNPPLVVITGQPGIGKTCWITYALCRRLGEKLPTVLYNKPFFFLFSSDGVRDLDSSAHYLRDNDLEQKPWCLVDAADSESGLPDGVSGTYSDGVNTIYVTSPTAGRWKHHRQNRTVRVGVMNPWSWQEMDYAARTIYPHRSSTLQDRFDRYGPSARICLEFDDDDFKEYESQCEKEIADAENMPTVLKHLIRGARDLDLPGGGSGGSNGELRYVPMPLSHKICLLRRGEVERVSAAHETSIMSKHIARLCAVKLMQLKDEAVLEVFDLFLKHDEARGMAGAIFEAFVHQCFRKEIVLTLEPMFQYQQGRYHASFGSYESKPDLKRARDSRTDSQETPVSVRNVCPEVFKDNEHIDVQSDVYYQPESDQQVGIDSSFLHDGYLYLIQMTVAQTHGIKDELAKFLEKLGEIPAKENWRFVFVLPHMQTTFNCPKPSIDVGKLYTARLDVSKLKRMSNSRFFRASRACD